MEKIGEIFLMICNMSVTAGIMVMLVVAARQLLGKAPKSFSYYLWGIVGFRLICPYSVPSLFSLFNLEIFRTKSQAGKQIVWNVPEMLKRTTNGAVPIEAAGIGKQVNAATFAENAAHAGAANVQEQITGGAEAFTGAGEAASREVSKIVENLGFIEMLSIIWLVGVVIFLVYQYISYRKLKRKVETAVRFGENIYECDSIRVPFVMGIIRPKIYLPFRISEKERRYIVMHEQYHIRRYDHLVKCAATILLAVYWFNPFVWVSYYLMCKDMEMSCDEKVIRSIGNEVKEDYSRSLLGFAVNRRIPAASPLAFGETSVKTRIRNVLRFKKVGKMGTVIGVVICMLTALIGCANGEEVNYLQNKSAGSEDLSQGIAYEYAVGKEIQSFLIYKEWYMQGDMAEYEVVRTGTVGENGVPRRGEFTIKKRLVDRSEMAQWDAEFSLVFAGENEQRDSLNLKENGYWQVAETYYLENEQRKEKMDAGEDIVLSAWNLGNWGNGVEAVPCVSFMSETKQENVMVNDGLILYHLVFSDKTVEELEKEYAVSPQAKEFMKLRNSYVGDAVKDGEILEALGVPALGEYTTELETGQTPHVLRINFKEGPGNEFLEVPFRKMMVNKATLMFAMIQNLDQVEWSYPVSWQDGNETRLWKLNRDDVAEMENIKAMFRVWGTAEQEETQDLWEFASTEEGMQLLLNSVRSADVEKAVQSGGKSDKLYVVQKQD